MKTLMIALVALLAMGVSQNSTDPRFEELSRLITQKMSEYHIPGVAFGILKNGQMTVRGFGITNIEDPLQVTGDTVFPIASISKTFAATAMVRLAQQGKLDLDAPVQRYLPDFRVGAQVIHEREPGGGRIHQPVDEEDDPFVRIEGLQAGDAGS